MNTTIAIIAAIAVRNPFWPIGFEGEKEEITAEPRVVVKQQAEVAVDSTATATPAEEVTKAAPDAEAEAPASNEILPIHWKEAKKSLRITGSTTITADDGTKRHCVLINGLTYGDGDLISVNHNGRRFTWRVQGLTEGASLKLQRVRAKDIEEEDHSKGDK